METAIAPVANMNEKRTAVFLRIAVKATKHDGTPEGIKAQYDELMGRFGPYGEDALTITDADTYHTILAKIQRHWAEDEQRALADTKPVNEVIGSIRTILNEPDDDDLDLNFDDDVEGGKPQILLETLRLTPEAGTAAPPTESNWLGFCILGVIGVIVIGLLTLITVNFPLVGLGLIALIIFCIVFHDELLLAAFLAVIGFVGLGALYFLVDAYPVVGHLLLTAIGIWFFCFTSIGRFIAGMIWNIFTFICGVILFVLLARRG